MTFLEFLRSCSLLPPEIITPGRWQRCGTEDHPRSKNGSFRLAIDNRVGFAQNFALDTECKIWRPGDNGKQEKLDMAAINARIRARKFEQERCKAEAQVYYDAARPLNFANHEYLIKKRLDMTGAYGLRVAKDGALVIPMMRGRDIASVQRIEPDGTKLFASGASVKGAIFPIKRKGSTVTILCEGLATGLTLFAAVPSATVIVAFSAANMIEVAKERDWSGLCVVAADNDHETADRIGRNPGLTSGYEAAKAIGCGVAYPRCQGSDFNDLFCEEMEKSEAAFADVRFPPSESEVRAHNLFRIKRFVMREVRYIPPKK